MYTEAEPPVEDRFRIRSVRAWTVGDSFPGLRRANWAKRG